MTLVIRRRGSTGTPTDKRGGTWAASSSVAGIERGKEEEEEELVGG